MSAAADGMLSAGPRGAARGALAVLAVAAVGGGAWLVAGRDAGDPAGAAVAGGVPTATVTASRRDLVDREDVEGSLGFADSRTISAGAPGTLTRVRPEGSIVRRGGSLFSLDARPTAYLLYGRVPMYRDLRSGVGDGPDVRQLERNLVALGYDPDAAIEVDRHWDWATTAAVLRWQRDRGVTRDGTVARGEIVFGAGPARVGRHRATVGDPVQAGTPITELTARRRVITARLQASRQALVHRGDAVRVTLPDGGRVRGRISRVGNVARAGENGAEATVELRVALLGRRARRGGLDQAPVTVSIATSAARRVLAVPVTALVATAPARYAVEIAGASGARRLVPVRTGTFAGGYVEIRGAGVSDGTRVVVPR